MPLALKDDLIILNTLLKMLIKRKKIFITQMIGK